MSTAPQTNPYFGRRWQLDVRKPGASSGTTDILTLSSDTFQNSLRMTFDVQTVWYQWYWEARIQIWNPNEQVANFLLTQGNTSGNPAPASPSGSAGPLQQGLEVVLSAGYQAPNYGVIWDGYVVQPMFERIDSVDFVITLYCVIGLDLNSRNNLGAVYDTQFTQQQIVTKMAQDCYRPITVGRVSSTLSKSLSFPKVVFGTPGKYFSEIANDNNAAWWLDQKGVFNVSDLTKDFPTTVKPGMTFTPTTGIIGTPVQTQLGVNCRLLLNPNIAVSNPPMAIKIDNTVIQQLQRSVGDQAASVSVLSQSGVYAVIGARHHGDTRGNDWYTDVTGWLGYGQLAALAAAQGLQITRS